MTGRGQALLLSFPTGGNAVVVGSSGGIGRALSDAIDGSERFNSLLRLSRSSDPPIDLSDEASIARAAERAAALGDIRLVIDATGFLHDGQWKPEKTWRDVGPESMAHSFAVNAIGPALVMKHFLPLLASSGKSVFATLSARVGSIGDNRLGGWYSYRASKAALNQLVRTAAIELKRARPEAICVALHPGTVETPLSKPFARSGLEVHQPRTAAEHLLDVIDGLAIEDTGGFFDWRGETVPW